MTFSPTGSKAARLPPNPLGGQRKLLNPRQNRDQHFPGRLRRLGRRIVISRGSIHKFPLLLDRDRRRIDPCPVRRLLRSDESQRIQTNRRQRAQYPSRPWCRDLNPAIRYLQPVARGVRQVQMLPA